MPSRKLILHHGRAPGDILVLTALVRDIKRAHPDWKVGVETPYRDLWLENPHVSPVPALRTDKAEWVPLSYGAYLGRAIKGEAIHFCRAYHMDLEKKRGIKIPLTEPRPDIHLSDVERSSPPAAGLPSGYWVVVAGGKSDFTAKIARQTAVQTAVDVLSATGIPFVQAGALDRGPPLHCHQPLTGVVDLLGKTTIRQFIRLIAGAKGVMCGVTFAQHLAAALGKPAVVWAGGREGLAWSAYHRDNVGFGDCRHLLPVNQRHLHTIGRLECCPAPYTYGSPPYPDGGGCWKTRVLRSEDPKKNSHCQKAVYTAEGQWLPECQKMISPERLVEAVLSYYVSGEAT